MGVCRLCGSRDIVISNAIGVCSNCLRSNEKALDIAMDLHRRYRASLELPLQPPKALNVLYVLMNVL
jgi:pyruvate formate lyase activating enzyme